MLKKIGILVFDDVEELDFVGPLEVFGMVSCGNQLDIAIIAETLREIRCHYGLRVCPIALFERMSATGFADRTRRTGRSEACPRKPDHSRIREQI